MFKYMRNNQGFSLPEIVIAVAVMAIVLGVTFTPIATFLDKKTKLEEEQILLEVQKTMDAYARAFNALPSEDSSENPDGETWNERLAQFTNLSPAEILTDEFGAERVYIHTTTTETFLGTDIEVHYASLHSRGGNLNAEAADGIPVGGTDGFGVTYETPDNADWWQNGTQEEVLDAFRNLAAGGDDFLIKFTDNQRKIDAYETTIARLGKVAESLETFAKERFTEAVVADAALPEVSQDPLINQRVYYPQSQVPSGAPADSANYASDIGTVMGPFDFTGGASNDIVFNDGGSEANHLERRDNMIELMRLLGLPDSFCCSSLQRIPNNPDLEMPFYFFSNPRPRVGVSCGNRPDGVTAGRNIFLPARITTTFVADGSAGATCG